MIDDIHHLFKPKVDFLTHYAAIVQGENNTKMNKSYITLIPRIRIKIKEINGQVYYSYSALGIELLSDQFILCVNKTLFDNELTMSSKDLIDKLLEKIFRTKYKLIDETSIQSYGINARMHLLTFVKDDPEPTKRDPYHSYSGNVTSDLREYNLKFVPYAPEIHFSVMDIYVPEKNETLFKNMMYWAYKRIDDVAVCSESAKPLRNEIFKNYYQSVEIDYVYDDNQFAIFLG